MSRAPAAWAASRNPAGPPWAVGTPSDGGLLGGTLTFDGNGQLTAFTDGGGWGFSGGVSSDYSADGLLAWGRWTAGTSTHPTMGGALRYLHYAGTTATHTTPAATLAGLKRSYTVARSTATTAADATTVTVGSPDEVTGTLQVDYAAGTAVYDLTARVKGQTFRLQGDGAFVKGGAGDARFLGDAAGTVTSAGGCPTTCGGWFTYGKHVQGLVVGPNGERAALGFAIDSPVLGRVAGLAVLR